MKITIEISDCEKYGLSPTLVYRKLCNEYWSKKSHETGLYLWGMATACNTAARGLYAQIKQRRSNVNSLILTYSDAEECFSLYKQFANVWTSNVLSYRQGKKTS